MATLRLKAPEGADHVTLPGGTVFADSDGYLVLAESRTEEGQLSPERQLLQAIAEQYQLGELEVTDIPATDAARAHAEETGVDLASVQGTGKGGAVTKSDVAAAAAAAAAATPPPNPEAPPAAEAEPQQEA